MTSRRGNGEGGKPRSHKSGGYYVQVRLGGKRLTLYGKTAAECKAKLRDAVRRHEDGAPVTDSRQRLDTWVDTWVSTTLEGSDRARATKDLYTFLARTHVAPALGHLALRDVRKAHVDALYLAMREGRAIEVKGSEYVASQKYANSTMRNVHAVLCWLFREAVDNDLIAASPMAKVQRPPEGGKRAAFLSVEQAEALVAALAADPLLLDYTKTMLLTGWRRGEGLGLLWEQVGDTRIEVLTQLTRQSDGLLLRDLKTDGSNRHVAITPPLAEVLRSRRQAQLRARMAAPAGTWDDAVQHEDDSVRHGLVFCSPLGRPLEPRNVLRAFESAVKRAGLPATVTIHTLRHSAASFLLAAGVKMEVVQKLLGHASYTTTSRYYAHVAPDVEAEASTKLAESLGW